MQEVVCPLCSEAESGGDWTYSRSYFDAENQSLQHVTDLQFKLKVKKVKSK